MQNTLEQDRLATVAQIKINPAHQSRYTRRKQLRRSLLIRFTAWVPAISEHRRFFLKINQGDIKGACDYSATSLDVCWRAAMEGRLVMIQAREICVRFSNER